MAKTTTTKTFYAPANDLNAAVYNAAAWETYAENWRKNELRKLQLKLSALDRLADVSYYRTTVTSVLFECYITLHGNFKHMPELPELPNMRLRRSVEGFPQYVIKGANRRLAIILFHDTVEGERIKTNSAIWNIDKAYPEHRTITAVEDFETNDESSDAKMD